jgi:glycosyltransferase involved in cell wall biosynthesis
VTQATDARPNVALVGFTDVFEDFYPHLGVDRHAFATTWAGTGNHSFSSVIHEYVGDVTWYELSLRPSSPAEQHALGMRVSFVRSSWVHRALWKTFYMRNWSWRVRFAYRAYATASSYLAPLSVDFVRTLRHDRPDALFVQDYSSGRFDVLLATARLLRVPLIAYHSGSTPDAYTGRILRRRTLRRADAILVSSAREAQHLSDEFGVDPALCQVVLTPIDTAVFSPDMRTRNDERYLLFVGRLDDAVKRVSAILAAFKNARGRHDVRLVVVGDGQDGPKVRALGQKLLGRGVEFLGWVEDPERLAHLYANADALVLASMREGFPTVVGEALACGTPVIATDVGGVSEVVSDAVTGRLIPAGDDAALTAALTEVIEHPALFAAMRPPARRVAEERLARAVVGGKLAEVFNRAVGDPSP